MMMLIHITRSECPFVQRDFASMASTSSETASTRTFLASWSRPARSISSTSSGPLAAGKKYPHASHNVGALTHINPIITNPSAQSLVVLPTVFFYFKLCFSKLTRYLSVLKAKFKFHSSFYLYNRTNQYILISFINFRLFFPFLFFLVSL